MSEELLAFNGVNGATGEYGLRLTHSDLVAKIGNQDAPDNIRELKDRNQSDKIKAEIAVLQELRSQRTEQLKRVQNEDERERLGQEIKDIDSKIWEKGKLGVKEGVDGTKIEQAGWGIIFAANDTLASAIQEALKPLLDLRQTQAQQYFKVYEGSKGFHPKDTKADFLKRVKASTSGPADPAAVPYYLLIVGSPEQIPYRFQYQLDVQYGVGRIFFESIQEYANYASSVVAAETGKVQLPRRMVFFGVSNPDDKATELSSKYLMRPLVDAFSKKPDWDVRPVLKEAATKNQLQSLIGGDQTPALLFTASHGMEFPLNDNRQIPHQGALLCQDWPGPNAWRGEIPQALYFANDDIASDAGLLGLITFHFACYGAGTPLYDEFAEHGTNNVRKAIAPRPFIAGLPQRLLSHPKGGALAVIGHVERAWGYSFMSGGSQTKQQTAVFESTLERILKGNPVGWATEYFNSRYAELSSDLSTLLEKVGYNEPYDPFDLTATWTTNNDARGYVILGDPAVRLPVVPIDQAATGRVEVEVPTITVSNVAAAQAAMLPKPMVISDEDWRHTPTAVQEYVLELEAKLPSPKAAKSADDDGW